MTRSMVIELEDTLPGALGKQSPSPPRNSNAGGKSTCLILSYLTYQLKYGGATHYILLACTRSGSCSGGRVRNVSRSSSELKIPRTLVYIIRALFGSASVTP